MLALQDDEVLDTIRRATLDAIYDPTPDLLDVAAPSRAPVRLLRYSPDDPQATVGRYCSLNSTSYLLTGGNHHPEYVSTALFHWTMGAGQPVFAGDNGPIHLGNDVWTGFNSVVMSGVTVGDGAIIGTGAVVTRDVEPYSIVGGVPARHIRYRFDQPERDALLRIRWWDWSEAKVAAHADQLGSPELKLFLVRHDPSGPGEQCPDCQDVKYPATSATTSIG
jgi:virginiamycin A acetyltransferase